MEIVRRPKGKSTWADLGEMKDLAFYKLVFYKVGLHQDPKKMIDFELVYPFARYNLKGQQRAVEINRNSEEWLVQELERRMLLNPAFDQWQVAMLIDNRTSGRPQKVVRYYERFLSGKVTRHSIQDWPMVTKEVYKALTKNLD